MSSFSPGPPPWPAESCLFHSLCGLSNSRSFSSVRTLSFLTSMAQITFTVDSLLFLTLLLPTFQMPVCLQAIKESYHLQNTHQSPSVLSQMAVSHIFSWLSSFPLCTCTASSLSSPLLKDTLVVSMPWPLWIMLQWTYVRYKTNS